MNDPLLYSVHFKENLPSKKTKGNLQNIQNNLDSLKTKAESSADSNGKGGGGGCIGRACYDRPVEAIAFPRAENDSYFSFKNDEDIERIQVLENDVSRRIDKASKTCLVIGCKAPANPFPLSLDQEDEVLLSDKSNFFIWGGVTYTTTELFRRLGTEYMGGKAAQFEVPIILVAAVFSAFIGGFILTPSEAEEGLFSLFSAVPVVLLKEIPFNKAKFSIFDKASSFLFEQFPVAREDVKLLSLGVSLYSGLVGGMVAAVVSNPADATISEMKKEKSDKGLDRGIPALFKGF